MKANNDPRYENIAACPNAGKRTPQVARYYVQEGLKAGFPDITVAIPRSPYHGLYIEFKRHPNKMSKEQLDWQERLTRAGYHYRVCWSFEEAREVVENWMK